MIFKIDNFCNIEECDQIIEALKEIAGDMHDMYHIGKSHGHNPLKHETVYQILKPKLHLLFGVGRFYSAWVISSNQTSILWSTTTMNMLLSMENPLHAQTSS